MTPASGGPRWGEGPHLRTSMTRIWKPGSTKYSVRTLPREEWAFGDYVLVEVRGSFRGRWVEVPTGRLIAPSEGDLLIGALGSRFATLEITGSWEDVGADGRMELLTGGGVVGRLRSKSTLVRSPVRLSYRGHVVDGARTRSMSDFAVPAGGSVPFRTPVILLTGSSMSAGKTTAAKVVVARLKRAGLSVLGAKLTGAGRYRDILTMRDAGADRIFDFVDAGLPSTHCSRDHYGSAMAPLLSHMAAVPADVAVIEIGASPLEPYNGTTAIEMIRDRVVLHVLCASDPYAVSGALAAYELPPDLVTGTTSNTEAGVQLVSRLTGMRALDIRRTEAFPELDALLDDRLGTVGIRMLEER